MIRHRFKPEKKLKDKSCDIEWSEIAIA